MYKLNISNLKKERANENHAILLRIQKIWCEIYIAIFTAYYISLKTNIQMKVKNFCFWFESSALFQQQKKKLRNLNL